MKVLFSFLFALLLFSCTTARKVDRYIAKHPAYIDSTARKHFDKNPVVGSRYCAEKFQSQSQTVIVKELDTALFQTSMENVLTLVDEAYVEFIKLQYVDKDSVNAYKRKTDSILYTMAGKLRYVVKDCAARESKTVFITDTSGTSYLRHQNDSLKAVADKAYQRGLIDGLKGKAKPEPKKKPFFSDFLIMAAAFGMIAYTFIKRR